MSPPKSYIQNKLESGDLHAFEILYNEHYIPLCHFAQRFVIDLDTAKEIVQDVLIRIWEKRGSLPADISLKTYLYSSVRNKCLDYLKHLKVENEFHKMRIREVLESGNNTYNSIDNPMDGLISKELESAIADVIENLPDKRRKIFELSRFEGLKYREIAKELNISVKTVETQMSRAFASLRKNLPDYFRT